MNVDLKKFAALDASKKIRVINIMRLQEVIQREWSKISPESDQASRLCKTDSMLANKIINITENEQ